MRQRDSKTTAMLDGLKLIVGEEKSNRLRADMGNGRIIFDRTLIAEREGGDPMPKPRMEAIEKLFPGTTEEHIVDKVAEATAAREKLRKGA